MVKTPHDDALVVSAVIGGMEIRRLLVDTGNSCDILYSQAFEQVGLEYSMLEPCPGPITGFTGHLALTMGMITLTVIVGEGSRIMMKMTQFTIVNLDSAYNGIIGRSLSLTLRAILLLCHQMIKLITPEGSAA